MGYDKNDNQSAKVLTHGCAPVKNDDMCVVRGRRLVSGLSGVGLCHTASRWRLADSVTRLTEGQRACMVSGGHGDIGGKGNKHMVHSVGYTFSAMVSLVSYISLPFAPSSTRTRSG